MYLLHASTLYDPLIIHLTSADQRYQNNVELRWSKRQQLYVRQFNNTKSSTWIVLIFKLDLKIFCVFHAKSHVTLVNIGLHQPYCQ
jgi:hypothetical protein